MTVTDLGYTGPQTILIYSHLGNLTGTYNTTADKVPLPEQDFVLIIKPTVWNQDLGQTLTDAAAWVVQYWYVIVFILGAIVLLTRRW